MIYIKSRYDRYILDNIIKHYKYEPFSTLKHLEEYLVNYPLDNVAYIYYAKILINVGRFDNALAVLDFIKNKFPGSESLALDYFRLKLLMFTHQYEEAFLLYEKNKKEFLDVDYNNESIEMIYDLKVLGKNIDKWRGRYLYNQIIDYDYDNFLNHIQKHTADYNKDLDVPNKVVFNSSFPLEDVLREMKKYIPCDKRLYFGLYQNLYAFRYDDNGRVNNKSVNYIRAVTVHDTDNFITVYPLDHGANLPYIDLNYLKEEKESSKVRKRNMVDRFNQKYDKFLK